MMSIPRHKTFAEKVAEVTDEIIIPLVEPVVIDYLEENPPAGGLTIEQIKSDSDLADSLTKKHTSGSDNQDLSNLVVKVTGSSLVADTEISKIHASGSDDQNLSGLQPKETGKGLSTNDYTDVEEEKLSGIEAGANNYTHPTNHAPSIISQDILNRFVTDTEKSTWSGKESGGAVASHESSYAHGDISTAYSHSQSAHLQFSGLAKITIGTTPPSNPQEGDLWIDTSN